jgi:hypothetical protein
MSNAAVTLAEAARELSVTPACVRGWIRAGAPCDSPGEVGRGKGAMVSIADLAAWRARRVGVGDERERMLEHIAAGLLDAFKRDAGEGLPLHRHLGIEERKVAALLVRAFEHIHRRIVGSDAEKLPAEIETLFSICVKSSQLRNLR